LSEIDYGEWVNLTFSELTSMHGETWRRYREDPNDLVLPGGESMPQVAERVGELVGRVRARFAEGRVALVSHADVIKLLLIELIGLDIKHILRLSIDNCSMLLVRVIKDVGARLIVYNPQNGFGNDMRFSSSKGAGTEV
ncbi:MAG TPA: histidine phosphatase family protein, partial [bacterium]|nr:histidine phosphatase family protein [bacterium]